MSKHEVDAHDWLLIEKLREALAESRLYCYRLESFFPDGIPDGWGDEEVVTLEEVKSSIDRYYQ